MRIFLRRLDFACMSESLESFEGSKYVFNYPQQRKLGHGNLWLYWGPEYAHLHIGVPSPPFTEHKLEFLEFNFIFLWVIK